MKSSSTGQHTQTFTEDEAEFLAENFLGRLATVSRIGQPHVVPVSYRFDGTTLTFGGWRLESTLKFRNLSSNNRVALVVDEVVSTSPWRVRGVEVRGTAAPVRTRDGVTAVRILPRKVRSWGFKASD